MPQLTGLSGALILLLSKKYLFAWTEIISFDKRQPDHLLWHLEDMLTAPDNSKVAKLDGFIVQFIKNNKQLSKPAKELLDEIKNVVQTTPFTNSLMSEFQKIAVRILCDPGFLIGSKTLLSSLDQFAQYESELQERLNNFFSKLFAIANGEELNEEEQKIFIENVTVISYSASVYLAQIDISEGQKLDLAVCYEYFKYLPTKFYQPGVVSRFGAMLLALIYTIIACIVLLNPITVILQAVACRSPLVLLSILWYPFLPFYFGFNEARFAWNVGWQATVTCTKLNIAPMLNRYQPLAWMIIGLALSCAATLVFVPTILPVILSLPYLSILANLSVPLLRVIAGSIVALIGILIAVPIITLATAPSLNKRENLALSNDTKTALHRPQITEAHTASIGDFTKLYMQDDKISVEHTFTTKSSTMHKFALCKDQSMECLGGLEIEYRHDKKFNIYLNNQNSEFEKHSLKIGNQSIVIVNGVVEDKLTDNIIFKLSMPAEKCVA